MITDIPCEILFVLYLSWENSTEQKQIWIKGTLIFFEFWHELMYEV